MLEVQLRAAELGALVSLPTIEARYDLVIDFEGRLYRAQVKYADDMTNSNSVILDLRKETRGDGKKKVYTKEEIDVLLVYVPKADEVLWIGPDKFDGRKSITLRFGPAGNGQTKGLHQVSDFKWVGSSTD